MFTKETRLLTILDNAFNGQSPNKEECKYLLGFDEVSIESSLIRTTANEIMRKKTDNSAIILGQVGVDVSQCTGGCKFCTFGEGHTKFAPKCLTDEELYEKISGFNDKQDMYGLFLMTMQDYDLGVFLNSVKVAKSVVSSETQIWSNVGDTSLDTFKEMKKAGIDGAYHVCRIGEGKDTNLKPEDRIKTMQNAVDAGVKLYTCCEPIGPEQTIDEIVDNMFIGIELGCTQHAAMRRVAVPNTPLAKYGQISELRLGQIVSVVALASFNTKTMTYCGVHEPNEIAYISGANIITAEAGANPRDNEKDTSKNRGMDMQDCRTMLLESGFKYIRRGDESKIELTLDYINGTV